MWGRWLFFAIEVEVFMGGSQRTRLACNNAVRAKKAERKKRKGMANHKRPWTVEDTRQLEFLWGDISIERIAKRLGRTVVGVRVRAIRLHLGPMGRGTKGLTTLYQESGYARSAIMGAAKILGIQIRRRRAAHGRGNPNLRSYAITEDQEMEILAWLRARPDGARVEVRQQGRPRLPPWGAGTRPEACVDCGEKEKPCRGFGRCERCYSRERMRRRRAKAAWLRLQERKAA